ncbi:MAG: YtxH domain-containing protein [Chloroflexi bacterium]|nr:MAG: YtxH domain-containing protein [Chloroflexota bacterium]
MVNVKDLQDVVDDLKDQASKRASELLGDSKSQVRNVVGGHSDGELIGTLVLGLVLGAIIGAALSLLFAPISGEEARRKLGENVERMRGPEPVDGNGQSRQPTSVGGTPYVSS